MNRRVLTGALTLGLVAAALPQPQISAWATQSLGWASHDVLYYVNTANATGLTPSDVISGVQTAAAAWAQSNANVALIYAGQTTGASLQNNGKNEVFFRTDPNGSVAATTYTWLDGSNHIVDADTVVWESDFHFFTGSSGCNGGLYLEDILSHEFGHFLGLGHSTVASATMFATFNTGCFQDWRSLDADDKTGIEALYPPAASVPAPAAPSQLTAQPDSSSPSNKIKLAWADNSSNESGFLIDRSVNGGVWTAWAQVGANVRSFSDTALSSGTTYTYRVAAFNSGGTSADSAPASAQTVMPTAPAVPTGPNPGNGATNVSTASVLRWTAVTGAQQYDVYFGTSSQPALLAANLTSASQALPTLANSTTYYWRVVARNDVGASTSPVWSFTTQAAKGGGKKK